MFLFVWSDVVCVYCLFAEQVWSLFWSRSCFVVFFSLFFFGGTCLLFLHWFFFFFPYKSLCSRSEIIISPSDLCFSLYSFISSRYDHNFIPVYWPKFIRKAEKQRNCLNLKSWSWFTESGGQTAIHVGPYFFLHGTVLHPKQTVKLKGSRIFRSDNTVRFGFQNLDWI